MSYSEIVDLYVKTKPKKVKAKKAKPGKAEPEKAEEEVADTEEAAGAFILAGPETTEIYEQLIDKTACYLDSSDVSQQALKSAVPGKEYFRFAKGKRTSRALNKGLWVADGTVAEVKRFLSALKDRCFDGWEADELNRCIYTLAVSFMAVNDLEKDRDQKTPGTFFERLVGHCCARCLSTNPRKQLEVLNLDRDTKLPTDYILDLGKNRPKFHVPVKTSTRERVVQVWAHQRVLDGVYGVGRFLGTLVCLAETKTADKKREVTEICLPDQWRLYQLFIAQMTRIYYLDVPEKYRALNEVSPRISVRPFGEFFLEYRTLAELDA
jgi:hypothetical protein